jgi:hypothetical protein
MRWGENVVNIRDMRNAYKISGIGVQVLRHKHVWGSGVISPQLLNLGTGYEWSASNPVPI